MEDTARLFIICDWLLLFDRICGLDFRRLLFSATAFVRMVFLMM